MTHFRRPKEPNRPGWPVIFIEYANPDETRSWMKKRAEAHIRERAGAKGATYRYLRWREGAAVKEIYLGSVRTK